jgi:hypothetical protein
MNPVILENIETIALAILALERIYQKVLTERAKHQSYLPRVSKYAKLITQLDELRTDIGADRVLLFKTHNGGQYSNGESIKKVSITQDRHEPHIGSVSQLFQGVLFENIPNLILKLWTEGRVECVKCTNATNDALFDRFLSLASIKHFYTLTILKKGRPIGFMAVVTTIVREEFEKI